MLTRYDAEKRPFVILIGLDTMQGIQAARILAHHQIPIIAICNDPHHPHRHTNVCREIQFAPNGTTDIMTHLTNIGPQLPQKAVLLPCQDSSVALVSAQREILANWYHIALPSHDTVTMLLDKLHFYQLAQTHQWPVPQTFILQNEQDVHHAAQQLTFPCILKPPYRSAAWSQNSSLKAFKVTTAAELLQLYQHYSQWVPLMIAQQWIAGDETALFSCNCYFDQQGQPQATFVARKLRQWPPQTGQSSLGESCADDTVLAQTLQLFHSVNYRGLGYVEFKKDAVTGKYFIVEPNIGRPTGRSAIAEGGNVALLYTMYCDLAGLPLPPNRTQNYKQPVKWIHWRRDLQSALHYWWHGELTLAAWWRSWRGRKVYALYSWRDPKPFLADLLRMFTLLLSRTERAKRGM